MFGLSKQMERKTFTKCLQARDSNCSASNKLLEGIHKIEHSTHQDEDIV